MASPPTRKELAWALYDWGNSAYATTVMVVLFPIFFKEFWHPGTPAESTRAIFLATSASSLLVALSAPLLGAVADRGGAKVRFLALFTLLGVASTGLMYLVPGGWWPGALALFFLSLVGFAGGLVYYDALLVSVARRERLDFVSALGYSLGYLGGGLLLLLNVVMIARPHWFGASGTDEATKLALLSAGVWWGMFALPLFLLVPEDKAAPGITLRRAAREGLAQFKATFQEIRRLRPVLFFLGAFWLYNDGVGTVMRTATAFALDMGLPSTAIVKALLVTQFVGFPAALVFGHIGEKLGPRTGIFICIAAYSLGIMYATGLDTPRDFFILAAFIGLVQGGIQALSRSCFARLIPPGKTGEFFGFYNMLGKFAAVAGPQLMLLAAWLVPANYSILSLLLLFGGGAALLSRVQVPKVSAAP